MLENFSLQKNTFIAVTNLTIGSKKLVRLYFPVKNSLAKSWVSTQIFFGGFITIKILTGLISRKVKKLCWIPGNRGNETAH